MANPKITDLDAQAPEADEDIPTKPIKLFGRTWDLLCDVNSYAIAALGSGDFTALTPMIDGLIAEDQRADFRKAFAGARGMTPERMLDIFRGMIETAAERPTTPPSGSSRTAATKRTGQKSAAGSSGRAVVRSVK